MPKTREDSIFFKNKTAKHSKTAQNLEKRSKRGAIAPVRYSELLASKEKMGGGWAPIFIMGAQGSPK